MLHCRYKTISCLSNKNLMSIEISILQAVNTKDKSDVPQYLQYQDFYTISMKARHKLKEVHKCAKFQ